MNNIFLNEEIKVIIIKFPLEKYDIRQAEDIYKAVQTVFPEYRILCLPDDIEVLFKDEEWSKLPNDYIC